MIHTRLSVSIGIAIVGGLFLSSNIPGFKVKWGRKAQTRQRIRVLSDWWEIAHIATSLRDSFYWNSYETKMAHIIIL